MDKIDELLTRAVDQIIPTKEGLEKILRSGKKIKIYIGVDPTAPQLHLGHSTNFLILKKLQNLGHKIIILIGDFTGMIGDPTNKLATRKPLTKEQVLENAKTYKDQLSKILQFIGKNPAEIRFNSTWLSVLSLEDLIRLMAKVTFQQLIERDMFQKRLAEGKAIGFHELIYPLLQGYDSVAMDVDAEMGGTDQTFNMLMGRTLMKELKNKEKFVITTELLVNPKNGKKLMNKSEGTYVGLADPAVEMFAEIMALPDETIEPIFRLCTTVPIQKVEDVKSRLKSRENPMVLKKELACEIVRIYHGQEQADKAQSEFENVFQKGQKPQDLEPVKIEGARQGLVEFLVLNDLAPSRSAAKRLIAQGAIEIDGQTIKKPQVEFRDGQVVKIGKRKFVRIAL